jgi:hypothetical protein
MQTPDSAKSVLNVLAEFIEHAQEHLLILNILQPSGYTMHDHEINEGCIRVLDNSTCPLGREAQIQAIREITECSQCINCCFIRASTTYSGYLTLHIIYRHNSEITTCMQRFVLQKEEDGFWVYAWKQRFPAVEFFRKLATRYKPLPESYLKLIYEKFEGIIDRNTLEQE